MKSLKSKKVIIHLSYHCICIQLISCSLQVECKWGSKFLADFLYELVPSLSNRDAVIVGGCGQLSSS